MNDISAYLTALDALPAPARDAALAALEREFAKPAHPADVQAERRAGLLSADDILRAEFPEPVWAVPNLLPAGLTLLAGRPKRGKSWLALQIALAVASGGHALGQHVERGKVLYLALEDSPRRLQERMRAQGWPAGLPVDFVTGQAFNKLFRDLNAEESMSKLLELVTEEQYKLVVIDTFSRAFRNIDQNDVQEITDALSPLQQTANELQCAVLLIDHHNKLSSTDAIDAVLGSTAKAAVCDCIMGLFREQGRAGAKLVITGRDVEERALALTFDTITMCWQCEGEADALEITERRQEILDAINALERAKVGDIAKAIGQDRSNTYKRLQDMVNAGLLRRERVGNDIYYLIA